jgi:outer membrane protein assembly factor BamB
VIRLPRPLAAALLLAVGCVSSTPSPSPPASHADLPDWAQYHRTSSRAGFLAAPGGGFAGAREAWRSDSLDGDVYGSPLVVLGKVLVATENDTVYAFDAVSGRLVWSRHLGTPVDSSSLPCGNIAPTSGITGTMAASGGTVFAVAFLAPARHVLFGLSVADGTIVSSVGVDPPGEDPTTHQQRAALAVGSERVYVAYGGLLGDCGTYHGWVIGAPLSGSGANLSYRVPSGNAAGIWAPSGPAIDSAGSVYVATGNSFSSDSFDYGNAVLRLSAGLVLQDWFAPSDWLQLNSVDGDLGSIGPLLLDSGLVFQSGKSGTGYLLRASHLGGMGGALFSSGVCPGGAGVRGGAAAVPPLVYVGCATGVVALRVDPGRPSFNVAWRSGSFAGGPPIVAGNAVWTADAGAGVLYGLDPASGRQLYSDSVGRTAHFATPAATDGLVFVAALRQVVALKLS